MNESAQPPTGPQRVAVVIVARNDKDVIAPTVRACRAIPSVDLIVVVDDGSDDETGHAARGAGAVVVRHSVQRGRASALETGVKVVAMRDRADWPPRHLLLLPPDLGDSAVEARVLVDAVNDGLADCAIGVEPEETRPRVPRSAENMARQAIRRATGWRPTQPFATGRCVTRQVVNAIMPFAAGSSVDIAATIDLLVDGFTVVELPVDFEHFSEDGGLGVAGRKPRRWNVAVSAVSRGIKRQRVPVAKRMTLGEQGVGLPYAQSSAPDFPGASQR